MIRQFSDTYKNFNLSYEESLAEIYYVLDVEFNISKQDILLGKNLSKENIQKAFEIFKERVETSKPIQYIIKKALFMNDIFEVDESVLIPRDDTQILVEKAVEIIEDKNYKNILDIGTGSGIIAIEIKKHTNCEVFAVDISEKALNIAKKNAKKNNVDINFVISDVFEKVDGKFDLIVSNPPYIPFYEKENLQIEVEKYEPQNALFAEDEGLFFYKKIIKEASQYLNNGGCLVFEVGISQAGEVKKIFEENSFENIFIEKDVSGIERVVGAFWKRII